MEKETSRPRLVIDTNVFVSGLISSAGSPAQILRTIQNKQAIHLVSDLIVEEYLRVLAYPPHSEIQGNHRVLHRGYRRLFCLPDGAG